MGEVALALARHGTKRRYDQGCRCRRCRDGQAKAVAEFRRARERAIYGEGDPKRAERMLECMTTTEPAIALLWSTARVKTLKEALRAPKAAGAVETLHWLLWRISGPMRGVCRCYTGESRNGDVHD